jgi:hypothetical protein
MAIASAPSDETDLKIGSLNITTFKKVKDTTKEFLKPINSEGKISEFNSFMSNVYRF